LIEAGPQQAGIKEGDIEEAAAAVTAPVGANDGIRHFALFGGKPEVDRCKQGAIALEKFVHIRHSRRIAVPVQSGEKW
jgi:hypothetical protein